MRALLPLILLPLCVTASADWVRVDDTLQPNVERYIDPDNVKQSGPMAIMRQVWEIDNYPEQAKDHIAATKTLAEYDCQNRQRRVLKAFRFLERWSKATEVKPLEMDQVVSTWMPVSPNTAEEAVIAMVCPGGEDG